MLGMLLAAEWSRRFAHEGGEPCSRTLMLLFLLFALFQAYLHHVYVDIQFYMSAPFSNDVWQYHHHREVLKLSPEVLPHSYRVLPFGIIAVGEWFTGSFFYAKTLLRVSCYYFSFLAAYCAATVYYPPRTAFVAVFILVMLYPISIAYYAGQPTDTVSHLAFFLAFCFLALRRFPEFALTVLVGLFAKETILVMAPCWFFCTIEKRLYVRLAQSVSLAAVGVVILLLIRLSVTGGDLSYSKISGIDLSHILTNLLNPLWPGQLLFQVGVLLPFWWRMRQSTPKDVQTLLLVLLPIITVSSLMFSWLHEARNFVPCSFLLALTAAACFCNKTEPVR